MTQDKRIDRINESLRIIREGEKHGATLRMMGGLAVRAHCEDLEFCEREYGDIDLIALGKQVVGIRSTFESLGYTEDSVVARSTDGTRLLFQQDGTSDHVDVFLDELRMEHTIDLRERLHIEELTISVSDILVTKLIIFDMNEKDYRDIFSTVKDLELGNEDIPGVINVDYIASICSRNWPLFQDLISNIDRCVQVLSHYDFSEDEVKKIKDRFHTIKKTMEARPKSLGWKLRALVGNRLPVRETVEEEDLHVTDLSTELSKQRS
ncbi:MAG: hypothetical protein ACFFFK_02180 [Candidatus Thorarchaeota archaeon]